MSMFDKDTFLQTETTGAMSTVFKPMPEHEALAVIADIEIKTGTIKKGDRAGETWVMFSVKYEVDSDEAREATNMDTPTVRQSLFVDINDDGMLDTSEGRNIDLGRLRLACNQNGDGPWSPMQMVGCPVMIFIGQRPDENDADKIYNEVKATTAPA